MSLPGNLVSILNPTIPVDQGIFEVSSDQKARLGTRLQVGDRVFRYAQLTASSNEPAGTLVCSPLSSSSYVSAVLTCSVATTGALQVTVTGSASVEADRFNEGHLSIASTAIAGGGLVFRVKAQASGGTAMVLDLYDALPEAISAAAKCSIMPNQYKLVKVGSKLLDRAAGVLPVDVASSNYFWLQTWGPTAIKGSAVPAGAALMLGTAGAIEGVTMSAASSGAQYVGQNIGLVHVASEANACWVTIDP